MIDNLVKKYLETPRGRKEWAVSGLKGSIAFWIENGMDRMYGGIECHYSKLSKPDYMSKSSYHNDCHLNTGGVCWHDGTSLWAQEYWIPHILPMGADAIWNKLSHTYKEKFEEEK